jgi:hypothetical protein
MTEPLDVAAIRTRWAAVTPGPWFWYGNTDSHNEALCGRQPGLGVCEVLSQVKVERTAQDPAADGYREYLRDLSERQIDGSYRELTDEEIEERVRDEYLTDQWGEPVFDDRLSLTDENYIRRAVSEVAVYQVARNQGLPDDTPRDHPKVYRADISDVRNANGRALAAAWSDVHALLAEVERLTEALAATT